jgi:hypothetical protein
MRNTQRKDYSYDGKRRAGATDRVPMALEAEEEVPASTQ